MRQPRAMMALECFGCAKNAIGGQGRKELFTLSSLVHPVCAHLISLFPFAFNHPPYRLDIDFKLKTFLVELLKNNNNDKIIIIIILIIIIIISKILRTVLFQKRVNDKDVAKHHIITHDLFLITSSF